MINTLNSDSALGDDELSSKQKQLLEERLRGKIKANGEAQHIPKIQAGSSLPLSFAQQRLWFLDSLQPNSSLYNIFHVLKFSFPVQLPVLQKCLDEIVRRHEILRTNFVVENHEPVQKIHPPYQIKIRFADLKTYPPALKDSEIKKIANREAHQPFDLSAGELLRACLVQLKEQEYLFFLSFHHIITDGWSTTIFNHELKVLYEAFNQMKPSPLPELPIQYSDFSVWQREWLTGAVLSKQLTYWKKQLENLPVLQLPTDKARTKFNSFKGECKTFKVSRGTYLGLKRLCAEEGCTLFMALLSGWVTLLFRYTGQEDIVVGFPNSGRNRTELENMMGFFVNTLVLRTEVRAAMSFLEVIRRIKEVTLDAYAHADLSFEKLVEELHPERDLGRNPLFQILFQLLTSKDSLQTAEGDEPVVDVIVNNAKFDITLTLAESSGELSGTLEYNTDLFFASTAERIIQNYLTLLQETIEHPEISVAELEILKPTEKSQLLYDWNNTSRFYPGKDLVFNIIDEVASSQPDHIAIFSDTEQLKYAQLQDQSNQLANFLIEKGIGPESIVVVLLDRSVKMVVVNLAILKAGAAFVPLDAAYPAERLRFMIEDTRASLIITETALKGVLSQDHQEDAIYLDTAWSEIIAQPISLPKISVLPKNRAYIIYTSGSTGKPKGVELIHQGLTNLVRWNIEAYGITPNDICLLMATPTFDAYILELFPAMAAGASIYLIDNVSRTSTELLRAKMLEKRISICFMTTSVAEAFWEETWPPGTSLRIVGPGGEKLMRLPDQAPPFKIVNIYGPTENTAVTTSEEVGVNSLYPSPPIGRALPNVQLYVLDAFFNPVPVGVPGELYIGGANLARGYSNRPALTAQRFVPDPFSSEPGARLYRTGDIVRYLPDRKLDFIGRVDGQIKLRGFRIELEEIEKVIHSYSQVREVVVVLQQAPPGPPYIIAYVAPHPTQTLHSQELREFLKAQLPAFMVPSKLVIMNELPKNNNGKVDRSLLRQQASESFELANEHVPPETEMEELVAEAWKEVLRTDKLSVEANFFDVGGHSLLMAQVHNRLKARLGSPISLIALFQYPTIRSLAKFLGELPLSKSPENPEEAVVTSLNNKATEMQTDRGSRQRQAFLNQKLIKKNR